MKIRINNIEYRKNSTNGDEIVLWIPNAIYGNEDNMRKDGWEFLEDGSAKKGIMTYHSSCFKNPETCYTIADIEWNGAHNEYCVRSIGRRAFHLGSDDYRDFNMVLVIIGKDICEHCR